MKSLCNGVAITRDGSSLLVSDACDAHTISRFDMAADASRRVVIGGKGKGQLQFNGPRQLCVAPDESVLVAEHGNNRVQVLTPLLEFQCFIGAGQLNRPSGVCCDGTVVAVSELVGRITVFDRRDGALLRRFASEGSRDGQLSDPLGLCFMHGDRRHIAVADSGNRRVSVFSVEDSKPFIRHVGVDTLHRPCGVACTASGELVVADAAGFRVAVFSASGELLTTMGRGDFTGVSIHGSTIFAQNYRDEQCVVFKRQPTK